MEICWFYSFYVILNSLFLTLHLLARTWDLMLRPLFCQLISLVAIHKGMGVQVNICLYVIVIGSSNWKIFLLLLMSMDLKQKPRFACYFSEIT